MAITRDKLTRAIENYIPLSPSVAQDISTNKSDPEAVFKKIQTLLAATLILDPNAIFYLVSIILSEVFDSADSILSDLNSLNSQNVLLSAEQTDVSGITDTSSLLAAVRAASGLVEGESSEAILSLEGSLNTFYAKQLKPLVQKRNMNLVDKDISDLFLSISSSLTSVTTLIGKISSALTSFDSTDIKSLAVKNIAAAVQVRVKQIQVEIATTAKENHADIAEKVLVDLAAAQAALSAISKATGPKGTEVIPVTSLGRTSKTYLTLQGTGAITPRSYIAKGSAGNPFVDYLFASKKGFASESEETLTASILSKEPILFPVSIASAGSLVLLVNGVEETIAFPPVTFYSVSEFVTHINSSSTKTTAYTSGSSLRIRAYHPSSTNPVGPSSSISVSSKSSNLVLSALRIATTAQGVGLLSSKTVRDSSVIFSSYSFPTTTVGATTTFDCFLITLAGTTHRIQAVDTTSNTITVSPGIPLNTVTTSVGTSYEIIDFSYIITKTRPGTLFESGATCNTTPLLSDRDGTAFTKFLLPSSSSTGNTETTKVQNPISNKQATGSITVASNALSSGQKVNFTVSAVTYSLTARLSTETAFENTFEIGGTSAETAENIKNAINSATNSFARICTASVSSPTNQVNLVATEFQLGSAGNSISLASTDTATITVVAFSGGATQGSVWAGSGILGTLVAEVGVSGTGQNIRESGASSDTPKPTVAPSKFLGKATLLFPGTAGYGGGATTFKINPPGGNTNTFLNKGVKPGDILYIFPSATNAGWYKIEAITAPLELTIVSSSPGTAPDNTSFKTGFTGTETGLDWQIHEPDYQQRFLDEGASFLTNKVEVGGVLTVNGTYAGSYQIASVISETELTVVATNASYKGGPFSLIGSGGAPVFGEAVTYHIPTHLAALSSVNNIIYSPASFFYGNVSVGDIVTFQSTEFSVTSITDATTLVVGSYNSGPANFNSLSYTSSALSIRRGLETSGSYSGQETTNQFKFNASSQASGFSSGSGLLDVGGVVVGNRIDVDTGSGTNLKDGYLKITSGASAGTYRVSSVAAVDSNFQTVTLAERLPVSAGGDVGALTWEALAGDQTNIFYDSSITSWSSDYPEASPQAGDFLIISPSEATEKTLQIKDIRSDTRITLEQEVTSGQSSLRYAFLPAKFPQAGNELVVDTYRSKISNITLATDGALVPVEKPVLVLEDSISFLVGKNTPYYIVSEGVNPVATFLTDASPDVSHNEELSLTDGFSTPGLGSLVGLDIELGLSPGVTTQILEVSTPDTLSLATPIDFSSGDVPYRIVTSTAGNSNTLIHSSTISESVQSGDYLTMWQVPTQRVLSSKELTTTPSGTAITKLQFSPEAGSGLSGLDFVVTRSGGSAYGRYLLLLNKLANLNIRLDLYKKSDLDLRLGEVLAQHGQDSASVMSSATAATVATSPDLGDGSGLTDKFDVSAVSTQSLANARIGDRISITYTDDATGLTSTKVCWVFIDEDKVSENPLAEYDRLASGLGLGADSATRCRVAPKIPVTTATNRITAWSITRNSISFALLEGTRLRLLMEEIKDIVEYYKIDVSPDVDNVLTFLRAEGLDRMADLLTAGKLAEFFSSTSADSSYQETMTKSIQEIGKILLELRNA